MIPVIVRRVRANARLLMTVVIGAVVAAALLSTTTIYADALRDLGLTYALRQEPADAKNIAIRSASQPSRADLYRGNRDLIADTTSAYLGDLLQGQTWYGKSSTFFPTPPGEAVSEDQGRPRANFQFISDLEDHITVSAGRLPGSAVASGGQPEIEVALGGETAALTGVALGDQFDLHPFFDEDAVPIRVTVVGIIDPVDPEEPYWLGLDDLFLYPSSNWHTLPLFVTEEAYFEGVVGHLPRMSTDFWSLNYIDTSRIHATDAEATLLLINGMDDRISSNIERTEVLTSLSQILATFDEKLFFTRLPILVLILQVAAIVLYYLFMVSTMLVERQAAEIALLKSRGATTAQVMQMYAMEGLAIAGIAIAAGPPLAAAIISLLGQTPAFSGLTDGERLRVTLSLPAYLWAAGGAALAYAALLWPAYQATRSTVVQYKTASARPPRQAAFTRYYLDLVLVVVGGILLYQLNRSGSVVTDRLLGGDRTADPVQLLTPALFVLAVAVFFLRLFPLVLGAVAWLVARLQGTAVLIGMWQLVRNPVHYSRLVLLLILATAVGMFAASFGATLNQSYEDRAAYEAGAPYRLATVRYIDAAGPAEYAETISEITGASAVSPAVRLNGSVGATFDWTSYTLLAFDPESIAEIAYFRDDFAGDSLEEIAAKLNGDDATGGGIELPGDARWVGLWVNAVELGGRVRVDVTARDATGRYLTFYLMDERGEELPIGWTFLVADLASTTASSGARFPEAPPQAPLTVESISLRLVSRFSYRSGTIQFDDLQFSRLPTLPPQFGTELFLLDPSRTFAGFEDREIIADFGSLADWEPLEGLVSNAALDNVRTVDSGTEGSAAEVSWNAGTGRARYHGLLVGRGSELLNVYANEPFMDDRGFSVGEETTLYINNTYVGARIVGTFSLFPTLVESDEDFALIADIGPLLAAVNGNPSSPPVYPSEAWIQPGPDTAERVAAAIEEGRLAAQPFDLAALRAEQEKDPLLAAGWEGILFLSFAAILLLSALGFLIYSYLTAQRRNLEFAILRTLGFSRRQIAIVVGFEQVFVIGLGMLAGSLVGLRLGTLMIGYMGLSETGDDVIPPMLLEVSWGTLAITWSALAAAFLVTIGIVVLLYSRLALHRVLRIGET